MSCLKNILIGIPEELLSFAKKYAEDAGLSFSGLVRISVAEKIGYSGYVDFSSGGVRTGAGAKKGRGSGGDLARFKTKETHARVCANMRRAKAEKHADYTRRMMSEIMRRVENSPSEKNAREIDENESVSGAA